jgi:hypothetical protein
MHFEVCGRADLSARALLDRSRRQCAGLRGREASRGTDQQPHAESLLELRDCLGYGRPPDVKLIRSSREEDFATAGQPVRPEVVTYVLGRYRPLPMSSVCTPYKMAETDESITRTGARSPGCTRSFPRFSPAAEAATCTGLHFPPKAIEPSVQSSAA